MHATCFVLSLPVCIYLCIVSEVSRRNSKRDFQFEIKFRPKLNLVMRVHIIRLFQYLSTKFIVFHLVFLI